MTIASEIQRIQGNISDCYNACATKNATMPVVQNSAYLANTINSISTGGGVVNKFGVTIDNLLGTPINGELGTGSDTDGDIVFDGVESLGDFALCAFMINRNNFTHNVSFPDLIAIEGENALWDAFYKCANMGTVSFPVLTNIDGDSCLYYAFRGCPFTTFTFPSLKIVNGIQPMQGAFYQCNNLVNVFFPNIEEIGNSAFVQCFNACTSLRDVYLSSSITSVSNSAFTHMFRGCSNVNLHLPVSMQSIIGTFTGFPNFGGTNISILFDL